MATARKGRVPIEVPAAIRERVNTGAELTPEELAAIPPEWRWRYPLLDPRTAARELAEAGGADPDASSRPSRRKSRVVE